MNLSQRGLTLIEVVISMSIVAFLALQTGRYVRNALKDRIKKQSVVEKATLLKDAIEVIKRDINLALHYHDPNIFIYNIAQKERQKRKSQKTSGAAKTNPIDPLDPDNPNPNPIPVNPVEEQKKQEELKLKEEVVLTQFLGTKNTLDFVSRSFASTQPSRPTSDIIELGFKVEECKNRIDPKKTSKCLIRRFDTLVDDKPESGGNEQVLIEDVKNFELSYMGPKQDTEWVDEWKTKNTLRENQKGHYPYAVKIKLTIQDSHTPKPREYTITAVAEIRNPNNEFKYEESTEDTSSSGSTNTETSSPAGTRIINTDKGSSDPGDD